MSTIYHSSFTGFIFNQLGNLDFNKSSVSIIRSFFFYYISLSNEKIKKNDDTNNL